MSLVALSSELTVNPEFVESIVVDSERSRYEIVITMKTGEKHLLEPGYKESLWEAKDRIVAALGSDQ